jgi:hypothetical protein
MIKQNTKLLSILIGFASLMVIVNGMLIGLIYTKENPKAVQASQNIDLSANCESLLNGGVALSNSKIITIDKNKVLGILDSETELLNGTVLQVDGKYTTKEGDVKTLENGQILDFQGNYIPAPECVAGITKLDTTNLSSVELKTE